MSGTTAAAALHVLANKLNLNSSVLLSVMLTTVLTVLLFEKYAKKKSPPEADDFEKFESFRAMNPGRYVGLFALELYNLSDQFPATKTDFDFIDAILATLLNVAFNILMFFVCYGVLKVAGVDKENLYERCKKAFMGLVILSFALLLAFDNFDGTESAQNVPAVTQEAQAEFVINLNGENIYIDRKSLVRIGDTHEDAAPEFKCVLIDDADIRTNCEFHARGVVVMFVDGVAVGDSIENPEIEELYNAIVAKFL